MEEVFTPRIAGRGQERMRVARKDVKVIEGSLDQRGTGWKAKVEIAGVQYQVKGAACSAGGCQCDAIIKPL